MNQTMLEAYFGRLGLPDTALRGEEYLSKLVRAHLEQIPFEDIDVYDFHKIPDLSEDALFEKLIVRKRGGYCFELNGLFLRLLQALGYEAYPVAVRITKTGRREGFKRAGKDWER
ncbi:MAG: arylamine N-acetyltransferase [Lachnospiraceae bacterium]|nr:arylamine N-acetyltransferase [Lachnospiraceae bacterium]